MQIQKTIAKNSSCLKELKIKDLKLIPPYDNTTKPAKKKVKQKKLKCRQKRTRKPKKIPATGNITFNTIKKKKKCDINKVMYFNYNKKSNYTSNCTESKN